MFGDVDLHRWQLSKTVKGDADDDIAKYDGLFLFNPSAILDCMNGQISCMMPIRDVYNHESHFYSFGHYPLLVIITLYLAAHVLRNEVTAPQLQTLTVLAMFC